MRRLFVLSAIILLIFSCQKFAGPDASTKISKHNEDESHNNGQNCMDCHYSAGNAEGIFTLGGSMIGNINNADVILSNDDNGNDIVKVIEVDQRGNAYTTEDIDFSDGLYAGVRNSNGHLEMMEDKIFHGQCNLCHGTFIEESIEIE